MYPITTTPTNPDQRSPSCSMRTLGGAEVSSIASSPHFLSFSVFSPLWAGLLENQSKTSAFACSSKETVRRPKNISTAAHVAINALSTLLLGASNYCMHIVSAPSRRDIDKMHSRKKVLDIGLNSISNTFKLGWSRRAVWILLGLSSIPLHLM